MKNYDARMGECWQGFYSQRVTAKGNPLRVDFRYNFF